MYQPQTDIEKAVVLHLFDVEVFRKPFRVMDDEYEASIVRDARSFWDERGRYHASVDINRKGDNSDLLDGDVLPITLWIEPPNDTIRILWAMDKNAWSGFQQSNFWPYTPVLGK